MKTYFFCKDKLRLKYMVLKNAKNEQFGQKKIVLRLYFNLRSADGISREV